MINNVFVFPTGLPYIVLCTLKVYMSFIMVLAMTTVKTFTNVVLVGLHNFILNLLSVSAKKDALQHCNYSKI